jgi:DNA polymerase-3 subunit epsilon
MWSDSWTSFDTETTGVTDRARIVEVAVVAFEKGKPVHEYTALLCPEDVDWNDRHVQEALAVNKIDVRGLQGKPRFQDIVADLLVELSSNVLVAHNAAFDIRMINQELSRLGKPALMTPRVVCTMCLAAHLSPSARSNKLIDVAARYDIMPNDAHRAAVDAETCGLILAAMLQRGQLPSEDDAIASLTKTAEQSWRSRRRW